GLQIDARSDLYSLGVTFYEMLTGRLPFERSATGSDWEIRKGHIELDPPSILQIRPEVHPQLAATIQRSFQQNPHEGYQSATEFLEAVRSYEQSYAQKEQALQSPPDKVTQSQSSKSTLQAPKSTLLDETATLLARPAPGESSSPRKSHLEDDITIPMRSGASSAASPLQMAQVAPVTPVTAVATTPPEITVLKLGPPSQPDQPRRKWPLAIGGFGLLLSGIAAGAIFSSQQRSLERAQRI